MNSNFPSIIKFHFRRETLNFLNYLCQFGMALVVKTFGGKIVAQNKFKFAKILDSLTSQDYSGPQGRHSEVTQEMARTR